MQKLLLSVLFASAIALPTVGQSNSRMELFGGYQFMHAGSFDGEGHSANTSGWTGSGTFNITKYLGVTADFSGNYKTENVVDLGVTGRANVHIYTYTVGPTVSLNPGGKIKPFVHALFGAAHLRPSGCVIFSGSPDECGSGGAQGFAMMFGGGVDLKVGERVAYRLVQADWVYLPSEFGAQSGNARVSTGLVFRF